MKRNVYVVAIILIAMLSAFFWTGGNNLNQALAAETTLQAEAGISAYAKLDAIVLDDVEDAFQSIEYQALDGTFLIGKVDAGAYADVYDPFVLVTSDGWILAYYPNTDVAGKMIDVMSRQYIDKTLLQKAVEAVGGDGTLVSYYDFAYPDATKMLLVGEYQADGDAFTLNIPGSNTYYEKSYGFYRAYEPSFTLDNDFIDQVNFLLTNNDYEQDIVYGTIYGHFGDEGEVDFGTDLTHTFTVWNRDFYAFGALAILYSGDTAITSADVDYVREIALTAPSGLPEISFDYTPSDFNKDTALEVMPLDWTLSWNPSTAPNYEYCITTTGMACDTGWVSVGSNLSVTLSNLFYETTYYWQVRAFNTTATVEADSGAWFSFTTAARVNPVDFVKDPGVLVQPVGGTIKLNMSWQPSYGAYYYEYCVDTTPDCVAPELWHNVGLATTATVSDLLLNTTYYWQVRAANYDATTTYYTEADGDVWAEVTTRTFSKINPPDLAVYDISKPLRWEATPDAISYEYCYDTVIDQACANNAWKSTKLVTQASFKRLAAGAYEWQVRANVGTAGTPVYEYANDSELYDTGDWWEFTVLAKSSKITLFKVSPFNGAIDQATSVTLTWKSTKIVNGYEYCYFPIDDTDTTPIADDDTCTGVEYAGNWYPNATTSKGISGLDNAVTYYWQVRANIGTTEDPVYIYADKGDFWAFTTEPLPVP